MDYFLLIYTTVDSWTHWGGVEKLIYGSEMKALPVASIQLKVGEYSKSQQVKADDEKVVFDLKLKKGDMELKGLMLDEKNEVIGGAYYVYVTRL